MRLASQDLLKLAHAAALHKRFGAPGSLRPLLLYSFYWLCFYWRHTARPYTYIHMSSYCYIQAASPVSAAAPYMCPHTAVDVSSCPLLFGAVSQPPLPLPSAQSDSQPALRSSIKPAPPVSSPPLPLRAASAPEPPLLLCCAACAPQLHQAIFG